MSHFSTLPTRLTDAEILVTSLKDLGLKVSTNTYVRGDSCQQVVADIVVTLEGNYDLGWSRDPDGSFNLIGDIWGVSRRHNQTELINSINQRYAVNKTLAQVRQSGHSVVAQSVGAGGSYQVLVTR